MSREYQYQNRFKERHHRGDKRVFGLLVLLAGIFMILKKFHFFSIEWHSVWPLFLIAIGLFIGVQKRFRSNGWWILILIGVVHLIPAFIIPGTDIRSSSLAGPVGLVILGLVIMLRPKRYKEFKSHGPEIVTSTSSDLNIDVTFGGRKEIVTSKDFRGGNVHVMFGGCELNLIQADSMVQPMVLDVKVSFGGLEIIVPANWELQNEIDPTFGSVEDHRAMRVGNNLGEEKRILVLRGTCTCGGIEIKSY